MAPKSSNNKKKNFPSSQAANDDDDDDFQDPNYQSLPVTQIPFIFDTCNQYSPKEPSNPTISPIRPSKKPKHQQLSIKPYVHGASHPPSRPKQLHFQSSSNPMPMEPSPSGEDLNFGLDSIDSTIDCRNPHEETTLHFEDSASAGIESAAFEKKMPLTVYNGGYFSNSIESRLLKSRVVTNSSGDEGKSEHFEPSTQLDVLLKLCSEVDDAPFHNSIDFHPYGTDNGSIHCPLCGTDISDLSDQLRQVHTNECLDKEETPNDVVFPNNDMGLQCPGQVLDGSPVQSPHQVVDVSPVLEWLRSLGLDRYEEVFVQEEIDWNTLQSLTEEDLYSIGVTALGPRKKILHAISEIRKKGTKAIEMHTDSSVVDGISKRPANRLITYYFPGSVAERKRDSTSSTGRNDIGKKHSDSRSNRIMRKNHVTKGKHRDIPLWCCIPGTPFRVDAFRYLRRDCSHWFLTHFHTDHYQGLTRSFCHGKIYCSSITARLVNMKIGIPWDNIQVLPLNKKISIAGINVTCFDANHCPGSIMILFEPPNGKAVLHTGDFRFSEEMAKISILQMCPVHTLILDTTYCDPQYDFPKQEAVIQFVIEAIQVEDFNPKTLFLIGSYTIGKERLFVEVARVLHKKVYVTAAKLRLLECLGLPEEDMRWFTLNEHESHIHVVPLWIIASFKRLKHISNQYKGRFSLIVAFSPTGWTFGKGKKSSPGRRWQQGTIIRYEVPYSEHCSFTELGEFVKFISPMNIIPSVNNDGPEATNKMVSLLLS